MKIAYTLFMVLWVMFFSVLAHWASERKVPATIVSIVPNNFVVPPGGLLRIHLTLERHKQCSVHVEHLVVDSQKTRWVPQDDDFNMAPGPVGIDDFAQPVPIDPKAAIGEAWYRSVRSYYCNPIHFFLRWPILLISPRVPFVIGNPVESPPPLSLPPNDSEPR